MAFINETDKSTKINNSVKIRGIIEIITFHNEETGYSILKMHPTDGYDGDMKLLSLTCTIPTIRKGEEVEIIGEFVNHPKYGTQIKVESIKSILPDTAEGILAVLQNGFLPHIGKVTATRLVERFGKDFFKVLEEDPSKLLEVKGISKSKFPNIVEAYKGKKQLKEIMEFSAKAGIGPSTATKIYKEFGDNAVKIIKKNPYQLIERIRGISFKKADEIALNVGLEKEDVNRIKAGLEYVLSIESQMGHCGFPKRNFLDEMTKILDVNYDLSKMVLDNQINSGDIIADTINNVECVFSKKYYNAEKNIAKKLLEILRMNQTSVKIPINLDKSILNAELSGNISLAESQKNAIKNALKNKVCIITGGPGVGKTTIIKTVLSILISSQNKVLLAAPTGRAAKRMKESTGYTALTIHRLLEVDPENGGFKYNEENLLDGDVVVIDETSMVDTMLMNSLLKAIPTTSKLILVGDIDQLPSVGAGQVLSDMINSDVLPVSRLTEIFRQAKTSHIITNAHMINEGKLPILENNVKNDFFFVHAEEPDDCVNKILTMVMNNIPNRWGYDPIKDVQILAPMKAAAMGTESMNKVLQEHLNPNISVALKQAEIKNTSFNELTPEEKSFKNKYPDEIPIINGKFKKFAIGDKVMQIKNNYSKNVFNGDVGYIENINTSDKTVDILFDDGELQRSVEYEYNELDEIVLAYACTVHKSQGSEYPVVIIPVMKQHFMMLQRKLLYTGVTRGKKIVILVGQPEAIQLAVRGKKLEFNRFTKLKERLQTL